MQRKKPVTSRKKRGRILLIMGIVLMATRLFQMDQVFMMAGIIFIGLGCGDMFYDPRYKRKYKSR